jgi:predicted HAD superfamily Cof-like phosphohydrolase
MSFYTDIKDFHEKFEIDYKGPPRFLPAELSKFRDGFHEEECIEYRVAPTLEDKLDALVDLVYVALGTAHVHGFDFDEAWKRVHAANMAKKKAAADGSDSKRGSAHDVIKPEGWTAPDLSDLVRS